MHIPGVWNTCQNLVRLDLLIMNIQNPKAMGWHDIRHYRDVQRVLNTVHQSVRPIRGAGVVVFAS